MSKSRYGRKKGKSRKKGHRKGGSHAARVRAGKKAWRSKLKRYGSKAAAIAATFGKKGRKGKKRYGKKAKRRFGGKRHRSGGSKKGFKLILEQVQRREGTAGWPATQDEVRKAEQIAGMYNYSAKPAAETEKDRLRRKFQAEKKALVHKLAAEKLRKAESEYKRELKEKAEREAESNLRDL